MPINSITLRMRLLVMLIFSINDSFGLVASLLVHALCGSESVFLGITKHFVLKWRILCFNDSWIEMLGYSRFQNSFMFICTFIYKLRLHTTLHYQGQSNWHKVGILISFHLFLQFNNIKIKFHDCIDFSWNRFHFH